MSHLSIQTPLREDERRLGLRPLAFLVSFALLVCVSFPTVGQAQPAPHLGESFVGPLLAKLPRQHFVQAPANPATNSLQANIDFKDIKVEELLKQLEINSPVPLAGRLTLKAKLTLPLETTPDVKTYRLEGTAQLPELTIGELSLRKVETNLRLADGVLHLDELKALTPNSTDPNATSAVLAGSIAVSVVDRGPIVADLQVRELDVGALTQNWKDFPVKLAGVVTGSVRGKMTYPAKGDPKIEGRVEVVSPRVQVQGVAAQSVKGHLDYQGGKGDFLLEGETLGGTFRIDGKIPAETAAPGNKSSRLDGKIRLQGIRLEGLTAFLKGPKWRNLHGRANVEFDYDLVGEDYQPIGRGRFDLLGVRWRDEEVVSRFQSLVELTPTQLRIHDFQGDLGGGSLRGLVRIQLRNVDQSDFVLSLSQSNVESLIVLVQDLVQSDRYSVATRSEDAADFPVGGTVSVNLRGRLGRHILGTGEVVLTRGQVMGLGVAEWRLPVQFTHSLISGSGSLLLSDGLARFASGQASGSAHLDWTETVRLKGAYRFTNVELRSLPGGSSIQSWTAGRVTGRLELESQNLRDVNDLSGSIRATLKQSQALRLPVVGDLIRFVAPGRGAAPFQTGDIEARLSRGTIRLKRLALTSPFLGLLLEGRIQLTGRLDLKATARTGTSLVNPQLLETVGIVIPAIGPIPTPVLIRITNLLANRVLYLRITGTVSRPHVRFEPLKILTEEAVRFLVFGAGNPLSL